MPLASGQMVQGLRRKKGDLKKRVSETSRALSNLPKVSFDHWKILDAVSEMKENNKVIQYDPKVALGLDLCHQTFEHHWPEETLETTRTIIEDYYESNPLGCAIKLSSFMTAKNRKRIGSRLSVLSHLDEYIETMSDVFSYHPNSIAFDEVCSHACTWALSKSSQNTSSDVEHRARIIFDHFVSLIRRYDADKKLLLLKDELSTFRIVAMSEGLNFDATFVREGTPDVLTLNQKVSASSSNNAPAVCYLR